ncbi:MAG: VWA domain-containing protein [Mangrovimonas sp.]|nr:VWA domain-containing protein [Mangrovimonas sp.]
MKTFKKALGLLLILMTLSCNAKEKNKNLAIAQTAIDTNPTPEKQFIKVALLLDTSNSMDGLIDQAKAQLWEIVNELSYAKCNEVKPNLEIALYEYGNNNLNGQEGYIRKVLSFSNDLDEISKQLFSLTTNGGEEYCGYVINTSLEQLDWGNDAKDLKLIFIAGNEPFNQGSVSYEKAAEIACGKEVTVNTIFCGDYNLGVSTFWKHGADLGHGDYMAINSDQATVHVPSPYDDKIMELNTRLNKTYVAYGTQGKQKMMLQAEQDSNASDYSEANAVSRTVSKSSHLYKNSSWDLVDAAEDKNFDMKKINKDLLPEELKGKSNTEIESYIGKKKAEREKIKEEIQGLNIKRQEFLSTQKTDNQLENAMLNALKSQAKKKNYNW